MSEAAAITCPATQRLCRHNAMHSTYIYISSRGCLTQATSLCSTLSTIHAAASKCSVQNLRPPTGQNCRCRMRVAVAVSTNAPLPTRLQPYNMFHPPTVWLLNDCRISCGSYGSVHNLPTQAYAHTAQAKTAGRIHGTQAAWPPDWVPAPA